MENVVLFGATPSLSEFLVVAHQPSTPPPSPELMHTSTGGIQANYYWAPSSRPWLIIPNQPLESCVVLRFAGQNEELLLGWNSAVPSMSYILDWQKASTNHKKMEIIILSRMGNELNTRSIDHHTCFTVALIQIYFTWLHALSIYCFFLVQPIFGK